MQYEASFVPPGEPPFPRSTLDQPHIQQCHGDGEHTAVMLHPGVEP